MKKQGGGGTLSLAGLLADCCLMASTHPKRPRRHKQFITWCTFDVHLVGGKQLRHIISAQEGTANSMEAQHRRRGKNKQQDHTGGRLSTGTGNNTGGNEPTKKAHKVDTQNQKERPSSTSAWASLLRNKESTVP